MIYGQGIDIVEIKRIEKIYSKFECKFLNKIFSYKELSHHNSSKKMKNLSFFAKIASRFAAKEAAVKAFGMGFREGIKFKDIEIFNNEYGKPNIFFLGAANKKVKLLENEHRALKFDLSISHEKKYAIAMVIISGIS